MSWRGGSRPLGGLRSALRARGAQTFRTRARDSCGIRKATAPTRISLTLNPGYDSAIPDERGRQMGVLIDGQWRDEELPQERGQGGDFRRADSSFRDRITADGSSGFKAEAGRYHLYVAHGCPWAHRTLIFRALKNLAGAISVAYAVPGLKDEGWMYEANAAFPDCTPDTVN